MAHLFRDLSLGHSKREPMPRPSPLQTKSQPMPSQLTSADLQSPLGQLASQLSDSDLRFTAYDVFLAVWRTSSSKPLSTSASFNSDSPSHNSPGQNHNHSPNTPALQRSLTSAAASKMKKALGLKSPGSSPGSKKSPGSGPGSGQGKSKRPVTVGELMRIQMRVPEAVDARVRRSLLRIGAGLVGRRIESVQLKQSDFTDQQEYGEWQKRNLKVLEAGLLLHPRVPLDKSNNASQRLRQIIHAALDRPIETGKNNESMQVLRTAVMSLASRSDGSLSDSCHWADGIPLNLRLYEILLETCFDINDETSIIEEVDELMEHIKKTWVILGINQMLHNLCFTWVLFHRFVATGQVKMDLLYAADNQLADVAKDVKTTTDPDNSKILSSTLSLILGWAEKRLLAYHDTFVSGNIYTMQGIVSLGVSAAKILVEDLSTEYRRKKKGEVDVARNRIDTYIRSSLRTAFAQANSSRRASKNQLNPLPILAILAKDVAELAIHEKHIFSPVLKGWHPLAAGITELSSGIVQVLRAADKLEKDLVQIAVEVAVDSDDGGKAIIREMPPYEAEAAIGNLVKGWIKTRVDRLKECVWSQQANQEGRAPSAVEILRIIGEPLDAFFQLPIPTHPTLLPDLIVGVDKCLQYYVIKTKSGRGSRNTYIPTMPALTRCEIGSKFQGVWKKKEKSQNSQNRNSQVAAMNGDNSFGTPQLCVRINTLHCIRSEMDVLEKIIITHLRNCESAHEEEFSNGLSKKFELTPAACVEGVQQLSEAVAYKIVFHDLSHVLWDGLFVGEPSSSRIDSLLRELEQNLLIISETVHERVRTRIITDIMKASCDGFLLVLPAGGPSRAFSRQDSQIIEDDFKALKDLFWANGDGLPVDLIDKFSATVRGVLPLFRTDTESLIERFRHVTLETYGSSARSRLPLPPTSGQWNPTERNTLLRMLCYRNDETASKFLKKTYNLPKKL
ncbi:Elongation factor Ts [Gossypium australe]|uniref:Elongation factor Ts n=1 Tax=Gossypium australe TaxID=47621 RepID=A0A5B6XCG0_9ROSI|nr:Elongation factor Ts [Gossypium australe]